MSSRGSVSRRRAVQLRRLDLPRYGAVNITRLMRRTVQIVPSAYFGNIISFSQSVSGMPMAACRPSRAMGCGLGTVAACHGLGLHLQIDFGVDVGTVEADMAE